MHTSPLSSASSGQSPIAARDGSVVEPTAASEPSSSVGSFSLRIDDTYVTSNNPNPTGAELLGLAGKQADHWYLLRINGDGIEVAVDPDATLDLRALPLEVLQTRPLVPLIIEGKEIPWRKRTITTEEIANLGGWPATTGVIEVDQDQNERTLAPHETVTLGPEREFGKRHRWKRGCR